MCAAPQTLRDPRPGEEVTKEHLLGTERRWRRFGQPVPAGGSLKEDGTPDYGIFGPGSVVWDVLLHPAIITFHHAGQAQMQDIYKPIVAGVRDWEPISRKGRAGTLTIFDAFERASRGAGMHLPLWLGDTATAERMAKHLHKIHTKVAGDIIDVGHPELGGYAAAGPRESLWAALTEMHPMLRVYEAFAFRGFRLPKRLPPETRDQFMAETAAYCRLHGADENEIPKTMAELSALYTKYEDLFTHSDTIAIHPETGEDYRKVNGKAIAGNTIPSHKLPRKPLMFLYGKLGVAVTGALPAKAQVELNKTPEQIEAARRARTRILPLAWILQRGPVERYFMRLMWGPDGVDLITSARKLHKKALKEKARARR
ncbi:oxygenase MpaB family protein [Rhodococcoides yunnanense]|uniref:oxygenase MpaB family protein n=1 Tax=Rhodococcoides yunnanense TaxID=278209 RepID=UPI0009346F21|nr:oxygenase MpaB family protein [Rhodococcus yunnanensis]